MKLSNNLYNVLKYLALIAIPAIEALWLGLSSIWGLPYGTEIGATVALVGVFIGALIGVSTKIYNEENKHGF